jgi:hypothetical protein
MHQEKAQHEDHTGLVVPLKATLIFIVDETGSICRELKVTSLCSLTLGQVIHTQVAPQNAHRNIVRKLVGNILCVHPLLRSTKSHWL